MNFKFYDQMSKTNKEGTCLGVCSIGSQNVPAMVLVCEESQTIHVVSIDEVKSVISPSLRKSMAVKK